MLVFGERGKPEYPEKNLLRGRGLGIEPGTHWWKASALTTAPFLLPKKSWVLFKAATPMIIPSSNGEHLWTGDVAVGLKSVRFWWHFHTDSKMVLWRSTHRKHQMVDPLGFTQLITPRSLGSFFKPSSVKAIASLVVVDVNNEIRRSIAIINCII